MVTGLVLASLFFLIGAFVSFGFGKRPRIWLIVLLGLIGLLALLWAAVLVIQH